MRITYDSDKNDSNIVKHGLSLDAFALLDLEQGLYREDKRQEYGEPRFTVMAPLDGRLCVAVFTPRKSSVRVISLRKCNERERKLYEKAKR